MVWFTCNAYADICLFLLKKFRIHRLYFLDRILELNILFASIIIQPDKIWFFKTRKILSISFLSVKDAHIVLIIYEWWQLFFASNYLCIFLIDSSFNNISDSSNITRKSCFFYLLEKKYYKQLNPFWIKFQSNQILKFHRFYSSKNN